jgi:hypothetical protein
MDILKLLYDYFPAAVYTGKCLVFISDQWRIELTESKSANFGQGGKDTPVIRVKIFKKAVNGEFLPGHFEDFQISTLSELATQIERYIQFAVGCNIRENV